MSSNNTQFSSDARFFTVSTAGHVDHGKTSLIRALTGIDTDRLKEEKERQMTTDLGFAHLILQDNFVIGFVDVPGHGKFLKNMLAGVGGIDLALLVVAADEGPMPQTVQHVRILSLLGVKKAIVALTKIDMVDDAEYIELVEQDIADLLNKHGMQMLQLVPVSSTKGLGIDNLKVALQNQLAALPPRIFEGGAFLPVDRVFSKSGFGTVITGTVVKGKLSTGDQIIIAPDVGPARVRRLECFGQTVEFATAGQRVACNVVLKENTRVTRGHVVLGEDIPATRMIVASLVDRPKIAGDKFAERVSSQPVRIYHGTAECHGYLRWAEPLVDDESSDDVEIDDSANRAIALIALDAPAVAQAHDLFVMRMSDETIYGGVILLRDRPKWIKRAELLAIAKAVQSGDFHQAILDFIAATPHQIARLSQISLMLPRPLDTLLVKQLQKKDKLRVLGETVMTPATRGLLTKRLSDTIDQLIKSKDEDASADGVGLETVRSNLHPKVDLATFQSLIDDETSAGRIVRKDDKINRAGATVAKVVDPATLKLQEQINRELVNNFCLDLDELAKFCKVDSTKIKSTVQNMVKQGGKLHLVNYEFTISEANLQKSHQVLADLWTAKRNISPSEFKENLGTTRKYAMALLQHFDDQKITRRLNDGRVLLKAPTKASE